MIVAMTVMRQPIPIPARLPSQSACAMLDSLPGCFKQRRCERGWDEAYEGTTEEPSCNNGTNGVRGIDQTKQIGILLEFSVRFHLTLPKRLTGSFVSKLNHASHNLFAWTALKTAAS